MATKPDPAAEAKFAKQEVPANDEWSEEQLEEGLKQLKLLHIKVRNLAYYHAGLAVGYRATMLDFSY